MNDMTMGQRIADQRKKLGLSQEALGEKLGVSRQAISKWESDGTVPEIDKLIGLSRLFSVSVGWLLGVEEDAPQPDELTETQIKMVEEIVRQYQPQPQPKKFPWAAVIAVLAAVLAVIGIVRNPSGPDYTGQIGSLQGNYQSIQSQLQSLSGRVEDIASAAEEADKVLQSHEFRLLDLGTGGHTLESVSVLKDESGNSADSTVTVDMPIANLTFDAVPKQRAESDRAWLVVLLNGQPLGQTECTWAGAGYHAEFSLWVVDGYEYRFVVEHEDGTQQIQVLEEYDYCSLDYDTSFHCHVDADGFRYNAKHWLFEIGYCDVWVAKPALGNCAEAPWAEASLILYRNGKEAARNLKPSEDVLWDPTSYDINLMSSGLYFDQLKLEEGDEVKLTFYAALDNGTDIETVIGRWCLRSGELQAIDEE